MNDLALQLAVSSVLQSWDSENDVFLQNCKDCTLQITFQIAGIKKTGYLEYLTKLREEIPAINAIGYWDKNGKFYEIDDKKSPYYDLIHEYNLLEYNNLFGKDNQQKEFFYLKEQKKLYFAERNVRLQREPFPYICSL